MDGKFIVKHLRCLKMLLQKMAKQYSPDKKLKMVKMYGNPSADNSWDRFGGMELIRHPTGQPTGCIERLFLCLTAWLPMSTEVSMMLSPKNRKHRCGLRYSVICEQIPTIPKPRP